MPYLIDTHVLIWLLNEPEKISETASLIINNNTEQCYISITSLWEIAIKVGLKKLDLKIPFDDIQYQLEKHNIPILNINYLHLQEYINLPLIHKDPFDRILVAQSAIFKIIIITKDPLITQYNVQTIW